MGYDAVLCTQISVKHTVADVANIRYSTLDDLYPRICFPGLGDA
jgi:hypothetical protein